VQNIHTVKHVLHGIIILTKTLLTTRSKLIYVQNSFYIFYYPPILLKFLVVAILDTFSLNSQLINALNDQQRRLLQAMNPQRFDLFLRKAFLVNIHC
jgi:cbb3-type cytochrome oxidase subunit 1